MIFAWVERVVDAVEQPADRNFGKIAGGLHETKVGAAGQTDFVGQLLKPAAW